MKTVTKFSNAAFAAFVPIPLVLAFVALAIGASTTNGAPGDLFEADSGSGTIYKFAPDSTITLSLLCGEQNRHNHEA